MKAQVWRSKFDKVDPALFLARECITEIKKKEYSLAAQGREISFLNVTKKIKTKTKDTLIVEFSCYMVEENDEERTKKDKKIKTL